MTGLQWWEMANDDEGEWRFWSCLWEQPVRAPQPTLAEQAPAQDLDTAAEEADRTMGMLRGNSWRSSQAGGWSSQRFSIFIAGADRQREQGRHGKHQPVPRNPLAIGAAGPFPLPPHALEGPESHFHPDPQTIPGETQLVGGQVSQHNPGFGLAILPDHRQGAAAAHLAMLEGRPRSHPGMTRSGNEVDRPLALLPQRRKGRVWANAHHRMPAYSPDLAPQPSISQDQHRPGWWHCRRQGGDQCHDRLDPGTFPIARQHAPGDGNRTSPIHHRHGQDGDPVLQGGGINRQGQMGRAPQGHHPAQQPHKTVVYVQPGVALGCPILTVVQPLPQVLTHRIARAEEGSQGHGHGILTGTACRDRTPHPPGQTTALGSAQHRQTLLEFVDKLITFRGDTHGTPPAARSTKRLLSCQKVTVLCPLSHFTKTREPPIPTLVSLCEGKGRPLAPSSRARGEGWEGGVVQGGCDNLLRFGRRLSLSPSRIPRCDGPHANRSNAGVASTRMPPYPPPIALRPVY